MLVLCRKLGEVIVIGDDIRITVTDISGDKVRLGIEAPRNITVNRLEVARRVSQQRTSAAGRDIASIGERSYGRGDAT